MEGSSRRAPETALVLTGGGARAAYQVGVIAALAERLPDVEVPILTGASAGAINATYLAGRRGSLSEAARGLRQEWARLTTEIVYGSRTPTLVRALARWLEGLALGDRHEPPAARGVFDTRSLRRFLEEAIDFNAIDANVIEGRLRALALSATSYGTGQTVTFVHGLPGVPVWQRAQRIALHARVTLDHLMASSAIPLVFPPVRLDGDFYGDGSVRQTFPLSPAIHLGARRILAIGTRPQAGARASASSSHYPSMAGSMGLLLDSVFMDHLDADAEVLESVNGLLASLPKGGAAPGARRPVEFILVRPSRDLGEVVAESTDRLPRMIRKLARALGADRPGGAEFLSYLLFDPPYTSRLVELGYADAGREWAKIMPIFSEGQAG